ncbi:hypothetical protein [Cylindrospermum sp. FACHB-282]|uniref:hypothetical protein n=1 Tax=Cylindrospermum sp. FACHB-282 TaxID=2692794 RepID=UPI0016892FA9|nr:hypothetical protein [Cylindrospermum sp. FACHB-282]MBD2386920.1 hypothetical protein [Cylindrospermum sp. FACHB-282]
MTKLSSKQLELFDLSTVESTKQPITRDPYWNKISVLEDAIISIAALPEHTEHNKKWQWIEEYTVVRSQKKHYYFRYCWYERTTRKIHHTHIPGGNVKSAIAQQKKQVVENAIALGKSPAEIEKIIDQSRT